MSCGMIFFLMKRPPPGSTHFPYPTLSRSSSPPASPSACGSCSTGAGQAPPCGPSSTTPTSPPSTAPARRSEEHTSELQSRQYLVCRLLLEKKKTNINKSHYTIHVITYLT